jgi:type IV secretion system coupling TraD/TrwB family protein
VIPTSVERRTRAFYEWEVFGRGWIEYTETVRLEPPFRPFIAQPFRAVIDDGRRPSPFSRLARLIGSKSTPNVEPEVREVPREPVAFAWADGLVERELLVPPDEKVDPIVLAEWLRNVAEGRSPVAFEILSYDDRVSVRFAAEQRDAARIRDQTLAFFPTVVVREPIRSLEDIWTDVEGDVIGALEFALAREFMLPLNELSSKTDVLTPIVASLGSLLAGDVAVLQVLFEPVREAWGAAALRAVTTPDGEPFFADAPDVTKLAHEKCAEPLYASVMRLAVATSERATAENVLLGVATAVRSLGQPGRNELTPLPTRDLDRLVLSILDRTAHRSGMILSLSDLAAIVRLPSPFVRSPRLVRPSSRTKAAPARDNSQAFVLGTNEHDGVESTVTLSTAERLRHCYVIGASGTGKSTLILKMALQDIAAGDGFAVLDPHGDLVDDILARIPAERTNDVIVFDPADDAYPIGFNILSAHSDLERTLLASDLVAVFRRLSASFGDQMVTVLGNAIVAFLESDEGGTLLDLQRFLVDKSFRSRFLSTVRDPQVVSYWRNEFPLLRGNPHASLLTRLNTFLRPKLIRHMVAQKAERFDVRAAMDERKILLARLSHGAIGEENAHLLGSLLVAKIAQAAMSRQNQPEASRVPFFVYIDEFHHFVTPSVASILSGARKYALGLTLAHQDMRQLRSRSEDVMSALLANAFTRVVFRVSDQDARVLADGFSYFDASDLQNLGTGEAIARIERPDFDFNLQTFPIEGTDQRLAASQRDAVVAASRATYARSRAEIEQQLRESYEGYEAERAAETDSTAQQQTVRRTRAAKDIVTTEPILPTLPGRGGPQHKYLQSLVKRLAEDRGFRVTVEKTVLDGHGHIDVALERDGLAIACEICVTTRAKHEVANLTKGLAAGFDYAALICADGVTLESARALLVDAADERLRFLVPDDLIEFLDRIAAPSVTSREAKERRMARSGKASVAPPTGGDDSKKRLLISRDAAAYLSLAPQTLAKMRWDGSSPPYFKIGRQVVYDPVDLDSWLAVRRRRSTSDPGPRTA